MLRKKGWIFFGNKIKQCPEKKKPNKHKKNWKFPNQSEPRRLHETSYEIGFGYRKNKMLTKLHTLKTNKQKC